MVSALLLVELAVVVLGFPVVEVGSSVVVVTFVVVVLGSAVLDVVSEVVVFFTSGRRRFSFCCSGPCNSC